MKSSFLLLPAVVLFCSAAQAKDIDLDCGQQAEELIRRLADDGLLRAGADLERARAIGVEFCQGAQTTAQEQHDAGLKQVLKNILFEDTGGKEGNERLKRLKH